MRNYLTTYDPFFDLFFPVTGENDQNMMKTDVIEKSYSYLLKVNIPGVKKEDVKISLEDGYLTINAKYRKETEEHEKYIYQERRIGEYTRSYYVDKYVTSEDIQASIEDGVLTLTVKKVTPSKAKQSQTIKIS